MKLFFRFGSVSLVILSNPNPGKITPTPTNNIPSNKPTQISGI
ncbi:hypothetical protein [Mycoplasma mycoides]|nr:hypothetical protein [Mycoplasma mycoides]